jgi:chromosome segregation ATPase
MSDDTSLFGAQIDADTADIIDNRLEYGEKSRLIREFAQEIAYGAGWDERSSIDIQIEHVEDKLAEARKRRRQAEQQIETYEDELARLREKRETKQTRQEKLDASLVPVEDDLRRGSRVFPDHGAVQRIAREYDITAEDVLERLKERNPDVPDRAFREPDAIYTEGTASSANQSSTDDWNGVDDEEINTPVENRRCLYRDPS